MTETNPGFTFSAIPNGSGGEDLASPLQHKRSRTDDVLCDKVKAVQVTETEPDSPCLGTASKSLSYASMLLNPLNHYGSAAIDDADFNDEDCSYLNGQSAHGVDFSTRLLDKLDLDWRCAVIIKLVANCVHQKKDRPSTTSHEFAQTATGNTDVDKPNSETVAMETNSQSPIISNDNPSASEHGPWMLMTYKSKKWDSSKGGNSKRQANLGSRFSVLETETEDTIKDNNVKPRATMIDTSPTPNDKEPRIVTLWKSVQQKLQSKNEEELASSLSPDSKENACSPSSSKRNVGKAKAMKDITNGKPVSNDRMSKHAPSKPKKSASHSTGMKVSNSSITAFSFPSPDITPLLGIGHSNPPILNNSATYGHCPPENDAMDPVVGGGARLSHSSNGQDCSDFASTAFKQAAVSSYEVLSEDSDNNDATMVATVSSSKDEDMFTS
ncbi:hypothetical protein M0R45_036611 [Rubus argutus]|uniref:Uncharacterized protein n=1 Tax=Rubus argutus TaxID=59490 RepID=A0AAW1VXI0_RUBAR